MKACHAQLMQERKTPVSSNGYNLQFVQRYVAEFMVRVATPASSNGYSLQRCGTVHGGTGDNLDHQEGSLFANQCVTQRRESQLQTV
jgi:hypothetical protein